MGNEYPAIPIVNSLPPVTLVRRVTPRIEYKEPTIVTPLDTEPDESYFLGLQEAVDRLSEGPSLLENRWDRGLLYGIREFHPENAISFADIMEDKISEELELLTQAGEMNRQDLAPYTEQFIKLLRESQTKALKRAQVTRDYQARILQLLEPDGLYVEGVPFRSHLEGVANPMYLDEDSEAYYELVHGKGGDYQQLQKKREKEHWVTKISGSIWQFRRPLIIAGSSHFDNKYGFVDLLSKKEIELHILNPRHE